MLLAETNSLNYAIYGMAILALAYIVMRPFMRRRKDPLDKPFNLSLAQQRSVERQMNSALVELAEMARQITAQLDTRAAKLSALLDEADRKIDQLKQLSQQANTPANDCNAPTTNSEPRQPPPEPEDSRHREVYDLADQGLAPPEIAAKLNRPRGEIELILA
ncbi:MAG: hypothetical protein ABSH20_11300, partial [Tepidisphaeraceae bacterium]